jgi:hypothetical protein
MYEIVCIFPYSVCAFVSKCFSSACLGLCWIHYYTQFEVSFVFWYKIWSFF